MSHMSQLIIVIGVFCVALVKNGLEETEYFGLF